MGTYFQYLQLVQARRFLKTLTKKRNKMAPGLSKTELSSEIEILELNIKKASLNIPAYFDHKRHKRSKFKP